jgi:hypothetical protein
MANAKGSHIGGRKSLFTQELADEICEAVSLSTKTLEDICEETPHFPHYRTVNNWRLKHKDFSEKYDKAMKAKCQVYLDEIIKIGNDTNQDFMLDSSGDIIRDKFGRPTVNPQAILRAKIQIDNLKFTLRVLDPQRFADKKTVDLTVTSHENWLDKLQEVK